MEMWKKSTKEKSRKKQRKNDDEDEDGNVIGEVLSEWTKENFPSPIRAAATNEHWERERNDDDEDDDDEVTNKKQCHNSLAMEYIIIATWGNSHIWRSNQRPKPFLFLLWSPL